MHASLAAVFLFHFGSISLSPTPEPDFPCFYKCEIIPFHIPVPARGKDKQVAQWATIAHHGASIMYGDTIICDALRQVALNLKQWPGIN